MNVIMFHSIGSDQTTWNKNWLSLDKTQFEEFCKFLYKRKYSTHFLDYWYNANDVNYKINNREIVLTFDDGYLDNLLVAYPILEKYKLKGTIFINPEFVDGSSGVRKLIGANKDETLGYLNWDEIEYLDKTKYIDIQSHTMSHNFYFHSNKIIDIYEGQDKYSWLGWIEKPESKPYSINENQNKIIENGVPIFEFGRALGLRRYFPNAKLNDYAKELYLKKLSKLQTLQLLNEYQKEFPGRYESDEEMRLRYWYELNDSKKILEHKLDKKIDYLCWPGGGYNDLSIALSIKAGYKASTISSSDKFIKIDKFIDYKRIRRFGLGTIMLNSDKEVIRFKYKKYLIWSFMEKKGNVLYKILIRLIRYKKIVLSKIKR